MPWFHRKTEEEKQQEDEQRARQSEQKALQEQSLIQLQRGGIPIQAQRRLDEFRQREGSFFTSDLTVNEFMLAKKSGVKPLSQVMGSSVYHVGWQYMPVYYGSQELETVTHAFNHARELALGRLAEEAHRVGANAVIGVHIKRAAYDWGAHLIEFGTVGTAVRVENAPEAKHPALTNLSGQDFWKLHSAGYWPVGVVAASTVYYVVASWRQQMWNSWGTWANRELGDFTEGLYRARHMAMSRVYGQCAQLGATGIVGVEIDQDQNEHEVEVNETKRTDMIFTFHAIGTAIRVRSEGSTSPPIYATLAVKP